MTHVRIVIDENVVFDGDLESWKATPPDAFKDMLRPGSNPAPWLKAIMISMSDALMTGQNVSIEAVTGEDKWAIGVTKT